MAQNSDYIRQKMKSAMEAYKAGDTLTARLNFQAALREDPHNTAALLWLAYIATDPEKQIFLLERVLQIDPGNERAQKGLIWAKNRIAATATQASAEINAPQPQPPSPSAAHASVVIAIDKPGPKQAVSPDLEAAADLDKKSEPVDLKEQGKKGIIAQRVRRRINPLLLLLLTAVALTLLLGWRFLLRQETVSVAALPPLTPTEIPGVEETGVILSIIAQTMTPTPTATNTPAATATPIPPSATPTPVILPTDTPTPPPTEPPVTPVRQPASATEKWIEVDLSDQTLIAWEGTKKVYDFLVSTGMAGTPTVTGEYHIYQKLVSTRMVGAGYDLPNVPHTMYFYKGFALHGAYWHNNFGQPMSHGCVNLSLEDAETLFNWADPPLPANATYINTTDDNPGTLVVVHE